MRKNHTYRLIVACFPAGLLCLVFTLQALHHLVGHEHHETAACSFDGAHIHDEENRHFSCSICLFHFEPKDLHDAIVAFSLPNTLSTKLLFGNSKIYYTQDLRQAYLRGPPCLAI